MKKRLSLTKDGTLTYCTASDENIGKGRCNHIAHQGNDQSEKEFLDSLSIDGLTKTISTDVETPICSYGEDGTLKINGNFGLRFLNGVQSKGTAIINGNTGLHSKFIKLDELNPYSGMHYATNGYDVLYPSVSEDVCSKFLENINCESLNSVLYNFETINLKGKSLTGTVSNNFIEKYNEEVTLSKPNTTSKVPHDDYIESIIDCTDRCKILDSMINFFEIHGVERTQAKEFILNQAAFDLITGNQDRKGNATNFTFCRSYDGNVKPINLDYGRCLQSFWSETAEKLAPDDETLDEIADDSLDETLIDGGLFGSSTKSGLKNSVDFLLSNGFEPFKLNIDRMNKDLCKTVEKTKNANIQYFTKHKVRLLNKILYNKEIRRLWRI